MNIREVQKINLTHVGKKFTKLSPRSWKAVMTAKIGTLMSKQANFRPCHILRVMVSSMAPFGTSRVRTSHQHHPDPLPPRLQQALLEQDDDPGQIPTGYSRAKEQELVSFVTGHTEEEH